MSRKALVVVAGVTAVAVGAIGLWHTNRPRLGDEEQITQTIIAIKQAAEARSAGGILRHVSDDYDDGAFRKPAITRLVINAMRSPEQIRVHVEQPRIEVSGAAARARVRAMYWLGPRGAAEQATTLDLTLDFARTGRGWQIVRATGWQAAGAEW